MREIFKNIIFILIIVFPLFCTGCSTTYEDMINDFDDDHFEKGYRQHTYRIDDESFEESEMLDDVINVLDGYYLILTAPDGDNCEYEWKATVTEIDRNQKVTYKEHVIGNSITLMYKGLGVFNTNVGNLLTLTVTTSDGKQYTDTAKILISK